MEEKELLERNKVTKDIIKYRRNQIILIEQEINDLIKTLKAPCRFCNYDGEYRCLACLESLYEGFNVADYPNNNEY